MKINTACFFISCLIGNVFAAVTAPSTVWQLNGNLNASVGTAAALGTTGGWTPTYQNFDGTVGAQVLAFPEFSSSQGIFVDTLNMPANGGGAYVNNYTIVMDVKFANVNQWISLYQTSSTPGNNDGDAFIRPTSSGGGVGISGDYAGTFSNNTWYRLGIVNDLAAQDIRFYLNGTLVNTVDNVLGLDGRWALYPSTDPLGFFLFGDNSGTSETGAGFLGSLAVWDKVLTGAEFAELGGASVVGIPEPASAALGGIGLLMLMRRRRY